MTGDEPWLALIAALRKDKLLVESDWRADPSEIASGVDKLCAQSSRSSFDWAELSTEDDSSTAALLNAVSHAPEADGVLLVSLDLGSDSFPMALLPLTSFTAASSLAATFGWQIQRHFA